MKIAIVGAGVVGTTTAYELVHSGHEVTVFEKNAAASEAASFANGSIHSNSFTLPLATPPYSGSRFGKILQEARQLTNTQRASLENLRWLWRRSSNSLTESAKLRTQFGQKMARMGMDISDTWIAHHQWDIEQSNGQLILLENDAALASYEIALDELKNTEQRAHLLERSELEAKEPALHGVDGIFKAIHIPGDRVMNCRQFSLLVKQAAQRKGAVFLFDTEVATIGGHTKPHICLRDGENHTFDHIVLCTESLPADHVLTMPTHIPTARVHSYALTAPIREALNAPHSAVQDHQSGITISRIGKRLRVCGGAELNRPINADHDKKMVSKLFSALDRHFPGAANYPAGTQVWREGRTFTIDGLPLIGSAGLPGIWLNLAHGASGWTFATASARLISESIMGTKTSLPCDLISPQRFTASHAKPAR